MTSRFEVFELIDEEREFQDRTWNGDVTASKNKHSPEEWLVYMQSYLTEAMHTVSHGSVQLTYPLVMATIRKITAMGVAAMEQHETPHRDWTEIHGVTNGKP